MANTVRAFDQAESNRLLERRDAVAQVLTEHDLDADQETVTAVLVAAESGVEVTDDDGRPIGVRPADTADVAAILDSFGVGAAADQQVAAAAEALEVALAEPAGQENA